MNEEITKYNQAQTDTNKAICELLCDEINKNLPEAEKKIWHGSPVWFIEGNPVAGYSVLKNDVQLLFWSGQSFDEPGLQAEGSFKAAASRYTSIDQVNTSDLARWLEKSTRIQWDYKNIVKKRGVLDRIS